MAKARRQSGARSKTVTPGILRRQVEGLEEDAADDDQLELSHDEAVESAAMLFRPLSGEEQGLLDSLKNYGQAASRHADSKAEYLIKWLKSELFTDGKWNDRRVIIFTEYRATQKWLHGLLMHKELAGGERLMVMYGGMASDDRERIKAAFQASPTILPVRILLATDFASEGIDLQNHCSRLIHYEIPWNPNRMEQRNGRIDRHGQRESVQIHHFVGAGFRQNAKNAVEREPGDLEGDLEFLLRAVKKVEAIREDLGKVGPVISSQVTEAMLGKRRHLNTDQAERDAAPARRLLRIERDLREQLKKLHDQLADTRRELHLDPDSIQSVVEAGLSLVGQAPLREVKVEGIWPDPAKVRTRCPVFALPPLTGSWQLAANGLEHPLYP